MKPEIKTVLWLSPNQIIFRDYFDKVWIGKSYRNDACFDCYELVLDSKSG